MIRLSAPFGDLLLLSRRERTPPGDKLSPFLAAHEIERAVRDPSCRGSLKAALGANTTRERIEDMLRRGDLVAIREPRRRVVLQLDTPGEVLGPLEAALSPEEYVSFFFCDAAGDPIADAPFRVTRNGKTLSKDRTNHLGFGEAKWSEEGGSLVDIWLDKWAGRAEIVPTKAPPVGPPQVGHPEGLGSRMTSRKTLLTAPLAVPINATTVIQLERDVVAVIEVNGFHPDGSVLLPGPSPMKTTAKAPQPTGIDVIRALLQRIHARPDETFVLAGHHSINSQVRAKSVALLLCADRAAWSALAAECASGDDEAHVLRWAAHTFGWHCDPDLSPDSRAMFTAGYNTERTRLGLKVPPLTLASPQAHLWSAFFDTYTWALWPDPRAHQPYLVVNRRTNTYPVLLARIAANSENRHTDLFPLNPSYRKPGDRGWRNLLPGEIVYLPIDAAWQLDRLSAAGYDVTVPGRGPTEQSPPPLSRDFPISTVGCGSRHANEPHAGAPRRTFEARGVDVLFAPSTRCPSVASEDQPSDPLTDSAYDPRTTDFFYVAPTSARAAIRSAVFQVLVHNRPCAGLTLLIADTDGNLCRRETNAHGEAHLEGLEGDVFSLLAVFDGGTQLPARALDLTYLEPTK